MTTVKHGNIRMERKLFFVYKGSCNSGSKHRNRRSIVHCAVTIGLKSKILEQCQKRNDKWSVEVETRLSCSMDIVADEGMYHSACHVLCPILGL